MTTFRITLVLSILLLSAGFVCPPMGVIDSSVLSAVGLLLAFATLSQVPDIIHALGAGKTIRLQKGDFTLSASQEQSPQEKSPQEQTPQEQSPQ